MSTQGITGKIVGGIGTGYSSPGPTSANTVPFTWTTGSVIRLFGTYEAA